jgi:hypothetical protein
LKVQADATYQLASFQLQVNSSYFLAGYNANDFQAKFSLGKSFSLRKEMLLMQLYLMQQQSMPMYQFSHMASKRFTWDNASFSNMGVSEVGLQLTGDRTKVKLAYSNIQNYCFINQLLEAQQSKVTQQLVSVQVKRRFTLHKLNLIPTLYYQKNLATEDVLRLPQLGGNVRAFFEGYLFKHATLSQAGIELSYIQAYKANGYAPLLNQFYLQDSVFTANYPQLDVFFNFKIRTVRVFVKVSNALDGIYPTKVYTQVPGYPMYGRIVRLGVVWRFMD